MEATEKVVSKDIEETNEVKTGRQRELLAAIRRCSYPTDQQLAKETSRTIGRIRQTLRALEKQGLVRQRLDPLIGTLWKAVPLEDTDERSTSQTLPCSKCGKLYDRRGLTKHEKTCKGPAPSPEPPSEDPEDDVDEDDPEVLEQAAPDVAEILKGFENGANKIRNLGWHVEVQVKLSYPNLPTPGAS